LSIRPSSSSCASAIAVRFRASSFPTIHGDKLVIRLLDMGANTLNLDALGFVPEDRAEDHRGRP